MAQYQVEAILVAVRDWGDADKIVTLFSREHGKLTAFANGARRPKSPLAGGMQLFTHVEVMLTLGKHSDSVKQCDVKNTFRSLQEDFNCMAYGAFIAELTAELCPERQAEPHIFDLLLTVLHVLTVRNPRIVALAYAWQLLAITGYSPQFGQCVLCGQEISFPCYFNFVHSGCVCSQCDHRGLVEVNERVFQLIHCLVNLNWNNPGGFSVNPVTLVQTEQLLIGYLLQCLEKPLKSMNFIKQVSSLM